MVQSQSETVDCESVADYVGLETPDSDPMILVGHGTPTDDLLRLIERLREHGYEVQTEYKGDHQRAYTVYHDGFGGDEL